MNWTSVKNLLIAILVAANLFLIFNIVRQDRTREYIPEEEIIGAAEILSERGLSVDRGVIPDKKFDIPVYQSSYGEDYYTKTAEALCRSEREMLYSLPNGGISITLKNGARMEFDTEFGFIYYTANVSDTDAYTEITEDYFTENNSGTPVIAARMKALDEIATDLLCTCLSDASPFGALTVSAYTESNGFTYLLARQTLDGYEIYSHYAICVFAGDDLIFAHGRWYFSDSEKNYPTDLYDQVSILFTDLQTLKSRNADGAEANKNVELPSVEAVSPRYAAYWNADKSAIYFIPAWQIDHTEGLIIVYNATNGEVYSTNE